MEYTEQQKKEYQQMRRKRHADQQDLKAYLKGGFEMSKEQKTDLLRSGNTASGKVFGGASNNKSEIRKTIAKRIKEQNKKISL